MDASRLDPQTCYRALESRDVRYDGRFFVGVRTTGIFCRSVCPAPTPRPAHCTYWPSAAAARNAGFRPCLRCRPESAPGTPAWQGTAASVSRALRLIDAGALDGEGTVDGLAERLGMGARHLRRLFDAHLGATPRDVAKMRRTLFAKQLIDETGLSMTEVALSAGFSSQRRFNACIREVYGRSPSALRKGRRPSSADSGEDGIEISLAYRPPFDWPGMTRFLAPRAIPGVELVSPEGSYSRTFQVASGSGWLCLSNDPDRSRLRVRVRSSASGGLIELGSSLRRLFDLDSDLEEIDRVLSAHPGLTATVADRPGLRVPGAFDAFETVVRTILGQQISVRAATTLAGRIAARFGRPLPERWRRSAPELSWTFPTAQQLREAPLEEVGVLASRARTIRELAGAVTEEPALLRAGPGLEADLARWTALRGIGPWTAHYVAMRVLREPDALPAGDLGLRKALVLPGAPPASEAEVRRSLEACRPFRAYAAMRLWSLLEG